MNIVVQTADPKVDETSTLLPESKEQLRRATYMQKAAITVVKSIRKTIKDDCRTSKKTGLINFDIVLPKYSGSSCITKEEMHGVILSIMKEELNECGISLSIDTMFQHRYGSNSTVYVLGGIAIIALLPFSIIPAWFIYIQNRLEIRGKLKW